ncbi:hypothetical protein [Oricola thermophila]|nr:hypothetical protein [Oricola thermophila]
MPWPVGRKILNQNSFPRGQGWDRTLEKLINLSGQPTESLAELTIALREHTFSGEKLSGFYRVKPEKIGKVRDKILKTKVPDSDYSRLYPVALSDEQLALQPIGSKLAAIEPTDDGVAVVFSSVRVITIREEIELSQFSDEAANLLEDYQEVFGLRTLRFQAFDVVWLPHNGALIDVRVDFPFGTHHDVAVAAFAQTVDTFHKLIGENVLVDELNLFPLIDRIYNDRNEGIVVELGFGTTTASLKHEKMRRKQLDLRDEQYHKGGKAALASPIEPFRLSVTWKRNAGGGLVSNPELSINSSARAAGGENPTINSVVIRKCMGQADYEFVRSRIETHLTPP